MPTAYDNRFVLRFEAYKSDTVVTVIHSCENYSSIMVGNYLLTVTADKLIDYSVRNKELEMTMEIPMSVDLSRYTKARLVFTNFMTEAVIVFASFCKAQVFGERLRRVLGAWPTVNQPWVPLSPGLGNIATFSVLYGSGQPFEETPTHATIMIELSSD